MLSCHYCELKYQLFRWLQFLECFTFLKQKKMTRMIILKKRNGRVTMRRRRYPIATVSSISSCCWASFTSWCSSPTGLSKSILDSDLDRLIHLSLLSYSPGYANTDRFQSTLASTWVKIISSWICYFIYTWTLLAPVFFGKCRDFS